MVDILSPQRRRFQALDSYVQIDLPGVRVKQQVWEAFKQYARLDDGSATAVLVNGEPPTLFVQEMGASLGFFSPDKPDTICLGRAFVGQFCLTPTNLTLRQKLEATLLHELVHWSLNSQKVPETQNGQRVEMGEEFETAAYGQRVLGPTELIHHLGEDLGTLSRSYESRGDPGIVGYDSTGGWSYGLYQLAANMDRVKQFLDFLSTTGDIDCSACRDRLLAAGGDPAARAGLPAFKGVWKEAATVPAFNRAQHDFIKHTHYDIFAAKLRSACGIDLDTRSKALRDVAWSTSVQHGPNSTVIFSRALGTLAGDRQSEDRALIEAVYAERSKVQLYFANSNPEVQQAVVKRFSNECAAALRELTT